MLEHKLFFHKSLDGQTGLQVSPMSDLRMLGSRILGFLQTGLKSFETRNFLFIGSSLSGWDIDPIFCVN